MSRIFSKDKEFKVKDIMSDATFVVTHENGYVPNNEIRSAMKREKTVGRYRSEHGPVSFNEQDDTYTLHNAGPLGEEIVAKEYKSYSFILKKE